MEKLGFDLDVEQQTPTKNQSAQPNNSQEQRRLSIQRCIDSLVHATNCTNVNCKVPSCLKMKRVVEHTKNLLCLLYQVLSLSHVNHKEIFANVLTYNMENSKQ